MRIRYAHVQIKEHTHIHRAQSQRIHTFFTASQQQETVALFVSFLLFLFLFTQTPQDANCHNAEKLCFKFFFFFFSRYFDWDEDFD